MRIGVIIPTRGDRPKFLENCLRQLTHQSVQPEVIDVVNDVLPIKKDREGNVLPDITWRYRIGYDRLRNKGLDLIALIEDDDWYHKTYLEHMANKWLENNKPNLLGTDFTVYYNIKLFAHFIMIHSERASAMNTFIVPDMNFSWCPDNEPYADMHLWGSKNNITNKVVLQSCTPFAINPATYPKNILSIGMKHGVGLCGGRSHVDRLHRYINKDIDKSFLKQHLDAESFKFYSNYFNQ